jgi:hypothetical protein
LFSKDLPKIYPLHSLLLLLKGFCSAYLLSGAARKPLEWWDNAAADFSAGRKTDSNASPSGGKQQPPPGFGGAAPGNAGGGSRFKNQEPPRDNSAAAGALGLVGAAPQSGK